MIVATLMDGSEFVIAGQTVAALMEELTAESLTGSAVPLADAALKSSDGREIRYGDVVRFEDVAD